MTVEFFETIAPVSQRIPSPTRIVNVVATLKPGLAGPSSDRIIVISGHYDNMASSATDAQSDAPGANDDGSGTAIVLELARVMSKYSFDATVVFMAVAGEEQELLGATAWAEMARSRNLKQEVHIPARELVPGDVVCLRAGDKVPADARVVEAIYLQAEEAALTGESVAVEKITDALPATILEIGDRRNIVHAGTIVTYGRGRALVVETGMGTEFGKIAQMLEGVETGRTPLQENLDRVGHTLARAALVIVAIIVAIGLWRGQPFIEMLIFGIALAVAVVPEALPAVVTISLSIGVRRMVKRNAWVRRLPAVETLGSMSVICSDKT